MQRNGQQRAIIAAERSAAAHERMAGATELQLIAAVSSTPDAQAAWQLVRQRVTASRWRTSALPLRWGWRSNPSGKHVVFRDPAYDLVESSILPNQKGIRVLRLAILAYVNGGS